MGKYVAKRIGYMALVFLIVSFLMYSLYNLIPTDPARAAAHFRKSFRLSRNPYDLSYYLADCLRARRQQKGQTP